MHRNSKTTFIESSLSISDRERGPNFNRNTKGRNNQPLTKIRRSHIRNVYANYKICDDFGDIVGIAVNKSNNSEINLQEYTAEEIFEYSPKSRNSLRTHYFWVKNSDGYEGEIFCKRKNGKLVLTAPVILEEDAKDLLKELPDMK